MKIILALVVVGFLATIGASGFTDDNAQRVPLSITVNDPNSLPTYDTLEEAAVHAIERAYKCSHAYECGGALAQRPDGKFVVGPVHSSYSGDSVDINDSVPPGWTLVGDYHTHPCNSDSHYNAYFSPEDMGGVTMRHITGIMGDLCTGKVHEFTPGKDLPNNEQPNPLKPIWLTQGRIVGQIKVDGISQEPDTGF